MSEKSKVIKTLRAAALEFITSQATFSTERGDRGPFSFIESAAISWPNRNFTAEPPPVWAGVSFLPAGTVPRTIGQGGLDRDSGILQIDVNIPSNQGEGDFDSWADKASVFFHAGRSFTYEGFSVIFRQVDDGPGRIVENHFRKTFSIAYRSNLKRHHITN